MTITINGTGTVTGIIAGGLPDAIITQFELATGVAGTGPAFSAYLSANQSITSNVATKVAFDTEEFDTNSNFASNRFTPTVAGYYQINATIQSNGTNTRYIYFFYKNGSVYKRFSDSAAVLYAASGAIVVLLNGSTDYIEVYGQLTGTGTAFAGADISYTYINGALIRSA